ncbi:MAG TPA: hypothetical protein VGJ32_01340 [Solirubrobacteraceae bacterium]|jgi:hypothetical protein
MDVPRIRYARNGRVHLAYQVVGDGPRDLLFLTSWIAAIEHLWATPHVASALRRLASFSRLILRLGDREWSRALDGHRALVRGQLALHGGREVKTLGDGFLADFDGPARAIRCALAVAEGSSAAGLRAPKGVPGESELYAAAA